MFHKACARAAVAVCLISASFGLASCETAGDSDLRGEPGYQMGYGDGCRSGSTHISGFKSTIHRDEEQFEKDAAYREGWRDGYQGCGGGANKRPGTVFDEDQWYSRGID